VVATTTRVCHGFDLFLLLVLLLFFSFRRKALGLPEEVRLLPDTEADREAAQLVLFANQEQKFSSNWKGKRQRIMTQSIFEGQGGAAGGGGGASSKQPPRQQHKPPPRAGVAATAAAGPGRPASGAKQLLQQRMLAAARKRAAGIL
jgi:hypothetical protein